MNVRLDRIARVQARMREAGLIAIVVMNHDDFRYLFGTDRWQPRAIIPFEMLSVLFQYRSREDRLPIKGPAVGLFADQEIRLLDGPLFVGESYELEREVVALSGSRRTESLWVRSSVFAPPTGRPVATMLLNLASIKDSLPGYAETYAVLYG